MLKKISIFFFSEVTFVLLIILLITVAGLWTLLYNQFKVAPPKTLYTFAHNYVPDFYQYLSWMKDGADGKILITSRYSPDNFKRQPVYLFYSLLGWLSARIGLPLFLGYTVARIFSSLLKLLTIYFLICQIFKKSTERKLAFFFTVLLPPFYHLFPFQMLRPDISSLDVLLRTFFLPHNLAATIAIMIAAIYFNHYLNASKTEHKNIHIPISNIRYLLLSTALLFLAGIANPALLTIFYLFLGGAVVITFLQKPNVTLIISSLVIFLPGFLLILYYQYLFSHALPFAWLYYQQKSVILMTSFLAYLENLGPVIFFVPFALLPFWKKKQFLTNFILSWAVVPFVLFPLLGKVIPFSQERFFEISHFLPLGILGAAGFYQIAAFFKGKAWLPAGKVLILSALALFSLVYLLNSTQNEVNIFGRPYFNIFIPRSLVEAYLWLDKNTPEESVVATPYFTANMLTAFAHNKVVYGHQFVTFKAPERRQDIEAIFAKETSPAQIEELLKKDQVDYLLVSIEQPLPSTNLSQIKGLKKIFDNQENQILKVNYSGH